MRRFVDLQNNISPIVRSAKFYFTHATHSRIFCSELSWRKVIVARGGSCQSYFFSVKTNSKVPSVFFLPQFSLKFIHILFRLNRPLTWKWRFYPNQPKCFWPEICSWPVLKIGVFSVAISKHILSPCVHSLWILTHQDEKKVFPEDFISKSLLFLQLSKIHPSPNERPFVTIWPFGTFHITKI